jgi:hypothetical protein
MAQNKRRRLQKMKEGSDRTSIAHRSLSMRDVSSVPVALNRGHGDAPVCSLQTLTKTQMKKPPFMHIHKLWRFLKDYAPLQSKLLKMRITTHFVAFSLLSRRPGDRLSHAQSQLQGN